MGLLEGDVKERDLNREITVIRELPEITLQRAE